MANEYWKMRGSYKSPLPIAKDRELLVDMNNGDVYFGRNGSNVPLSNVADLQTMVSLLLAKKILELDESFYGKSGYAVCVNSHENGFVLSKVEKGEPGDPGVPATITIRNVVTGDPGTNVSVTNHGTNTNLILDISIPRGADGTGGDMSKSTYDTDNDGKVDAAETADAVPWGGVTNKPSSYYTHPNHSGDATSVGDGAITLVDSGVSAGTYKSVTVDAKGRVTNGTNPTTLAGYGITDAPTLVDGKIQATHLPSYVDDVLEYANYASLPASGTSGIIYITTDTDKSYRWTGTVYAEIVASPGTTDAITEGSTNLWHTTARVLSTVLTGLSTATNAAISATDTILSAFGKLAARVNAIWAEPNIDRINIPAGATAITFPTVGNKTYTSVYIFCQDLAGAADTPTSLTVSVAKGGTTQFTTGAITTAASTYDNTDFNTDDGDYLTASVSNTTGVAGSVMVGLRWVRR